MKPSDNNCYWWSAVSLRIAHKELDAGRVTEELGISPSISLAPGASQIHHGDCKSAGYWCGGMRIDYPKSPTELINWIENLVEVNEGFLQSVIDSGADVNTYLGVHANVMSVGFDIPATPVLNRLRIRMGIEFFGR